MSVREKIKARLDEVEKLMNDQTHLENPDAVLTVVDSVAKFWAALSDDDRDFINSVRYAIEDQVEWKQSGIGGMADAPALGAGEKSWGFKSLIPYHNDLSPVTLYTGINRTIGCPNIIKEYTNYG